jgi:hypothetical protein
MFKTPCVFKIETQADTTTCAFVFEARKVNFKESCAFKIVAQQHQLNDPCVFTFETQCGT